MEVVKIKNLNKSHMKKAFIVKGRVKYTKVEDNKTSDGKHLNSILFDDSSEIEIVAFKDCDKVSKLLSTGNVVKIENGKLKEVNKDYKKTKHKYKIILLSNSIITSINNDDFPTHKYTSGAALKTLIPGMIIDVIGVLVQINSETAISTQSQIFRKGIIKVDSTEIEVKFYGEQAEELYNVGNKLSLSNVKYINFKGYEYLSVGHSSSVKRILHQLPDVPATDLENSTIESSDNKVSNSIPSSSNNSFTIGSLDQNQLTSDSTPCNKRKSQDFNVKEVTSKILKLDEPKESFSDEKFTKVVLNLLKNIKNNKEVVKLRIIEFISEIIPENDT